MEAHSFLHHAQDDERLGMRLEISADRRSIL
jgi:hypothetical protein